MNPRPVVTDEVLRGHLACRSKGYLKWAGQAGTPSDYGALLAEQQAAVRQKAIESIAGRHPRDETLRDAPLTAATLQSGPAVLLDARWEDDPFSLRVDGLERVPGPSELGDFHYVPVLFHGGAAVRKDVRLLLDVWGILLAGVQGRMPRHGVIWHGPGCRAGRVRSD